MIKTARMTRMPSIARASITLPQVITRQAVLTALQIPAYPIPPPSGAENLGKISWDQPEMVKYVAGTEVNAYIEMVNPSDEERLYCISYYFLAPDGTIAEEGMLNFVFDTDSFQAFYLPAHGVKPAYTTLTFSASECDYTFGLRMLLLELTDSTARVIQETSRVQVMLASEETYNKHYGGLPGIEGWLPMPPNQGPPLPRLFGLYWPWYKK